MTSLKTINQVTENPDTISIEIPASTSTDINVIKLSEFYEDNNNNKKINYDNSIDVCDDVTDESNPIKVLLILNQEIKLPIRFFKDLWNQSILKICADGGSTRLYNYAKQNQLLNELIPDYIVGDLDSLSKKCEEFYLSKGTKIKQQSSQYSSDLQKSITLINLLINYSSTLDLISQCDNYDGLQKLESEYIFKKHDHNKIFFTILTIGAIGGRFDQSISIIGQITKCLKTRPNIQFLMLNSEYLEFIIVLKKGKNFIQLNKNDTINGLVSPNRLNNDLITNDQIEFLSQSQSDLKLRNIGLLPLVKPVVLSTNGLKWDVSNWSSHIGGAVSTSNLIVGDKGVFINTSDVLFVNIEF